VFLNRSIICLVLLMNLHRARLRARCSGSTAVAVSCGWSLDLTAPRPYTSPVPEMDVFSNPRGLLDWAGFRG
jgi:hypothetical protein